MGSDALKIEMPSKRTSLAVEAINVPAQLTGTVMVRPSISGSPPDVVPPCKSVSVVQKQPHKQMNIRAAPPGSGR